HLHTSRPEHDRGGDLTAVSHSASRDDRHLYRIDHLRQQGEQARLLANVDAGERATMPSSLGSLGNDSIDPAILEDARFCNGGGATNDKGACAPDGVHHVGGW